MNRRYLLYLTLVPLAYVLYHISVGYSSESPFFYGFAENKETELSHYSDSYVEKILVSEGEVVERGQVLMHISRRELPYRENELERETTATRAIAVAKRKALATELALLSTQKVNDLAEIDAKIKNIEADARRRQAVVEALSSVQTPSADGALVLAPAAQHTMDALIAEKASYLDKYQLRSQLLQQEMDQITTDLQLAGQKVTAQTQRLDDDVRDLQILAPANGVIGNIPRKEGEYVTSYTTLLTFYEENPTLVKGYVHESLILEVNIGDSLYVASTLREENSAMGLVIGLGSRIVEIPERLRKITTFKTYGREVLVQIPANNSLLQKEKVSINTDLENKPRSTGSGSRRTKTIDHKSLSLKK